jgi:RND family efflux transporter MFP subunit
MTSTSDDTIRARVRRRTGTWLAPWLALASAVFLCGCARGPAQSPPAPPRVEVSKPLVREVIDWDEYTGRLEAVENVEVRARVSGYLESIHFKDGSIVKKGDLLFVIDPRPYEAVAARARAERELAQARLELARKDLARAENLLKSSAISKEETDTRAAAVLQSEAQLAAAAAAINAADLDVEFTRVMAPVSGRIGRHLVSAGNLIDGGGPLSTLLTSIVSLDPIQCYFEADERSYLRYARLALSGKRASSRDARNPVHVQLADEEGFPHEGYMDFVDNQFDRSTNTMTARAVLPNPDLLLSPGVFVRIRLPGSGRYEAMLLPDEAISNDQAQQFVFVVNAAQKVEYREVTTGPMHDGLRAVREGLTPDDQVIVKGAQRVQAGMTVTAEPSVPPPSTAANAETVPPARKP